MSSEILKILKGIDQTQIESEEGWWETSEGARFGAQKLDVVISRFDELLEAMEFGRTAIGEHIAPSDCYATGPLTGNYIEDFIVCPACRFISAYEKAIAKAKGEV